MRRRDREMSGLDGGPELVIGGRGRALTPFRPSYSISMPVMEEKMSETSSTPQQTIEVSTEVSEPISESYQPPRLIRLGKAKGMIRGALASGYTDSTHDWYSTGE